VSKNTNKTYLRVSEYSQEETAVAIENYKPFWRFNKTNLAIEMVMVTNYQVEITTGVTTKSWTLQNFKGDSFSVQVTIDLLEPVVDNVDYFITVYDDKIGAVLEFVSYYDGIQSIKGLPEFRNAMREAVLQDQYDMLSAQFPEAFV